MTSPVIDYTSRDFAAFRASMLAFAQTVAPEWKGAITGDPNDFGVILVELLSYEGDILSYYADRIANESFLTTATQRGSVLAHAALLDYTPRSATAASVDMSVTVTSAVPTIIPAGFQISTLPNGDNDVLTFETVSDLSFPASNNPVTLVVRAAEGQSITDEVVGTSCADLNALYTLQQTPVISESLVVSVVEAPGDPGQVWVRVNSLLEAKGDDKAYSISLNENDALTIQFGDGVNGRVPPRGAVIHAGYRVGGGEDGNVLAGTVTEIVDPTDYSTTGTPTTPPLITVVNQSAASGGTDSESLESIRINAPKALRARSRAVTLSDYEALALTIPSVQIAKAKAVAQVYTNVTIYVAPPGGQLPDQDALDAVVDYMDSRKMAGVTVVAATPQYVSIDIEVVITVDSRYSQTIVKQAARNSLQNLVAFDNVSFGGTVSLSSLYAVLTQVEGVTAVRVTKLSRDGIAAAADVVLRDNELPISGAFLLQATGGVVNSQSSEDILGGSSSSPSAAGAPSVDLIRCDPNSTHVELSWIPGVNTTEWDVVVSFLDTSNTVLQSTVYGTFLTPHAILDLPRIGQGAAATISFVARAYNNSGGPVDSSDTGVPYTCEGTVSTVYIPVAKTLALKWNQAAPPALTAPALSGSNTYQNFSLNWTTVPGAIGYTIYRDGVVFTSYGPANGTASSTGLSGSDSVGSHTWTVKAYNAHTGSVATASYGPSSNAVTLNLTAAPPPSYTQNAILTSAAWSDYTRYGDGHVNGTVVIHAGNFDNVSYVVDFKDAGNNYSSAGSGLFGGGTGPSTTSTDYNLSISGWTPPAGFAATEIRVRVTATNPYGNSSTLTATNAY